MKLPQVLEMLVRWWQTEIRCMPTVVSGAWKLMIASIAACCVARLRGSKIYDCRASLCGKLMPAALLRTPERRERRMPKFWLPRLMPRTHVCYTYRQRRGYDVLRSVCSGPLSPTQFVIPAVARLQEQSPVGTKRMLPHTSLHYLRSYVWLYLLPAPVLLRIRRVLRT